MQLFAEKGLIDRFVRVPGHTRVNVKVVDDARHQVTDINFPGVMARAGDIDAVTSAIDTLAGEGAEVFVLSGSLPAGVTSSVYRDIALRLKARGRTVVVDTSGRPLAEAIVAAPHVVKPNVHELAELAGCPLDDETAIEAAAQSVRDRGVDLVVVSMGGRGAIFVSAEVAVHAVPPSVPIRSTVGAGDAMVAGIIHSTLQDLCVEDSARLATAFSLGALGEIGPRLPPRDVIEGFARQVTTRRIAA